MRELLSKAEDLWKTSRVLPWILVLIGTGLALWISLTKQSPGVSIGILAAVAGVMSVRPDMHFAEKIAWIVLLVTFTILEVHTIKLSDHKNEDIRDAQNKAFDKIAEGLKASIETSKTQYDSTITHVDSVLTATQQAANLAKDTLQNLTGGNGVAYIAPQPPDEDGNVPLAIVNPSKFPLTGVTVVVADSTAFPFKTSPVVTVGTLAAHLVRPIDIKLKPTPGINPPGVASFVISIYAQNGTSEELLQFRKGKKMLWDYRASVSRSAPVPHTMNPKQSKPTSDIPGLEFTYGWIEDRPKQP
jgi:archaellum component FlaF (FlaF/FlaG flagellin family)